MMTEQELTRRAVTLFPIVSKLPARSSSFHTEYVSAVRHARREWVKSVMQLRGSKKWAALYAEY